MRSRTLQRWLDFPVAAVLLGAPIVASGHPAADQMLSTETLVQAVEYFHKDFEHYFITASPAEIDALDSGALPGWWRTGQRYRVYAEAGEGRVPVCRFYTGAFAGKPSHVYTASPSECAYVKENLAEWIFEGVVFHVQPVDADGKCVPGHAALHRLYNGGRGGAPNHAYTPEIARRDRLIQAEWVPEGAVWCVPTALEDPAQQTSLLAKSKWELSIPDPMSYGYGTVRTVFAAELFRPAPPTQVTRVFQYPFDRPEPAVAIAHEMPGPGVWSGIAYFEALTGRFLVLGTSAWNNTGDAWEFESLADPTSAGCYFFVTLNVDSRYPGPLHPFQPVLWSGCQSVSASRLAGTQ